MNLETFRLKFEEIKSRGCISTKKRCPTWSGQTLEQSLGFTENNIALPDLDIVAFQNITEL